MRRWWLRWCVFLQVSLSLFGIGRKVNHNKELSLGVIVRDFPVDNDELQIDLVLVGIEPGVSVENCQRSRRLHWRNVMRNPDRAQDAA